MSDYRISIKIGGADYKFSLVRADKGEVTLKDVRYSIDADAKDSLAIRGFFRDAKAFESASIEELKKSLSSLGEVQEIAATIVAITKKTLPGVHADFSPSPLSIAQAPERPPGQILVETQIIPRFTPPGQPEVAVPLLERMKDLAVPGVGIAVINNGEIEWFQNYGDFTPETVSQASSVTKTVTAVTVLSLIADKTPLKDGKQTLTLETDVRDILEPDLWKDIAQKFEDHKVTIRMLLTHTAGITVSGFDGYPRKDAIVKEMEEVNRQIEALKKELATKPDDADLTEKLKKRETRLHLLEKELKIAYDKLPTTDEILRGEGASPPVKIESEPGSRHEYSGGGTMILQKVVETLTGKSFSEAVQTRVLTPLDMGKSKFSPDERTTVRGVNCDGEVVPGKWRAYPELAAAGLWTTAQDLAKLAKEIQQPGKILTKSLVQEMTKQVEEGIPPALGGFVEKGKKGTTYFFHPGSTLGFRSLLLLNDKGQGACIMTNSNNGVALYREILLSIAKAYNWPDIEALPMRPLFHPDEVAKTPIDKDLWAKKYAGEYQLEHAKEPCTITLKQEGSKIMAQIDREAPFEIVPMGDKLAYCRRFDPGPYSIISFAEDRDGNITLDLDGKFVRRS